MDEHRKGRFDSILDSLKESILNYPFAFLLITFIFFAIVWGLELGNALKALSTILVSVSLTILYLSNLSKIVGSNAEEVAEGVVQFFFVAAMWAIAIAFLGIATNDTPIRDWSIVAFAVLIVVYGILASAKGVIIAFKKISESSNPVRIVLLYTIGVIFAIIFFAILYSLFSTGGSDITKIKQDFVDQQITNADTGTNKYLYYSAQVFYANMYGDLYPSSNTLKFISIAETWLSFIIHVIVIGVYLKRPDNPSDNPTKHKPRFSFEPGR